MAQTSQPAAYAGPVAVCELKDPRITEASGIVPSFRNPGCYYVHNDSGDTPRVFLIDRTGRTRATINLKGATAIDYEDIALAPGDHPGTFDVCAADIGDNHSNRKDVAVYRFPDVELKPDGPPEIDVTPTAYRFRYSDGPADAEAFFVHPRTGDGYILTKRRDGRSLIYKLAAPWNTKGIVVLPKVLNWELPPAALIGRVVTAADISSDGRRVVVRCYLDGWEWRVPADVPDKDFERIFKTEPVHFSLPAEPQGEGICFSADGRSLLTISEGKFPTLWETPLAVAAVDSQSPASQP